MYQRKYTCTMFIDVLKHAQYKACPKTMKSRRKLPNPLLDRTDVFTQHQMALCKRTKKNHTTCSYKFARIDWLCILKRNAGDAAGYCIWSCWWTNKIAGTSNGFKGAYFSSVKLKGKKSACTRKEKVAINLTSTLHIQEEDIHGPKCPFKMTYINERPTFGLPSYVRV